MTSGVSCRLKQGIGLNDLLRATFPPGSVTGAPKINTMRIISAIESSPRKVYTGAIGFVEPNGDLTLSVAIRTVNGTLSGQCEMGVGSGIVSDSVPEMEFEETMLKAGFLLNRSHIGMELIETMLLCEGGSIPRLEDHLSRMEKSAAVLLYPFNREKAFAAIEGYTKSGIPGPAVVRLLLTVTGDFIVELIPYNNLPEGQKVVTVSSMRTDPGNPLLGHKTTARSLYDTELARVRRKRYLEVLFINTDGHLTEGAFTNIFIHCDSGWRTPDISCGLLPGIWRGKFIDETGAVQCKLTINDLRNANSIFIGNSVRGTIEIDEVVDPYGLPIFTRTQPIHDGTHRIFSASTSADIV
jgi:para-aminobenzoate synthetase/4-amino-4-deoxychorismate lyase